jgi:hypothetical protein
LHPTNQQTNLKMTITNITQKTGYKVVYQQTLSGMETYELTGLTVFETYNLAITIGNETAEEMTTKTMKTVVKYIIAIPMVSSIEVEHINYLS